MIVLDLEHCLNCEGGLKITAVILERSVIEKILSNLGLQAQPPPPAPAREPMPLHAARVLYPSSFAHRDIRPVALPHALFERIAPPAARQHGVLHETQEISASDLVATMARVTTLRVGAPLLPNTLLVR